MKVLYFAICLFRRVVKLRVSNEETSCTHKTGDNHFNYGQIMQCIVTYATGMYS